VFISQILDSSGRQCVVARAGSEARIVSGIASIYDLALAALGTGRSLVDQIEAQGLGDTVDLQSAYGEGRVLAPISHRNPTHVHLTGTGLTHLGSAATRDKMHQQDKAQEEKLTDSMKMFRMGVEGGKSRDGKCGVQPEWFYKGNGHALVVPGGDLPSPCFALDAGEEPEVAGIYVIDQNGQPVRIGFAIANEFSDHVTERQNYLFLAHSKLRHASIGPEILIGDLPKHIEGTSRILRNGKTIWEKPFLSGEANMSHTIDNLEHHHFKYEIFRQPGDVHVHMFGTATLSFADGVSTEDGDVFEIEAPQFGLPLRNRVAIDTATDKDTLVKVAVL